MAEDVPDFDAQNPSDTIVDPVLIDAGFDKKQMQNGTSIIHPYLVLGTLPDKVWHLQSPDLFADKLVSGRYGWGDIAPWSSLQASGLLDRTGRQLVTSTSLVQATYAAATTEARRTHQCMSLRTSNIEIIS